jgi:hypothetical protein
MEELHTPASKLIKVTVTVGRMTGKNNVAEKKNSENRGSERTCRNGRTVVAKIDMSLAQSGAINGARVVELQRCVTNCYIGSRARSLPPHGINHLEAVCAQGPRATRHFNKKFLVLLGFFLHQRAEILYALDGYLKCNTAVKCRAN